MAQFILNEIALAGAGLLLRLVVAMSAWRSRRGFRFVGVNADESLGPYDRDPQGKVPAPEHTGVRSQGV